MAGYKAITERELAHSASDRELNARAPPSFLQSPYRAPAAPLTRAAFYLGTFQRTGGLSVDAIPSSPRRIASRNGPQARPP